MLIFLKLGGSLITEKDKPGTPRLEVIQRLAAEIASAKSEQPELQLVIGHGSGSFGHAAAIKYATAQGVSTHRDWLGFADVWLQARRLNQLIIENLAQVGLPVIAFPPSATVVANQSQVEVWDPALILQTLASGLIPVVQGDVVFDRSLGGSILSTEAVFEYLALQLKPNRILLAGLLPGVFSDFPQNLSLVGTLHAKDAENLTSFVSGSASVDVTGGMLEKVQSMLRLTRQDSELKISIFSGEEPGNLKSALLGNYPGTLMCR